MTNTEFVKRVRALIGKPYSECDCKDVIAKALGIRFSGTNWLWRSAMNSRKYRYLSDRISCPIPACDLNPGDILFKIREQIPSGYDDYPDAYHVAVYIGDNRIVHSSPKTGVRADDYIFGDWQGCGRMKQVEYRNTPAPIRPDEGLTDHEMIKAIYEKICKERND